MQRACSLLQAIANEAGINFISVKGPELLNMVNFYKQYYLFKELQFCLTLLMLLSKLSYWCYTYICRQINSLLKLRFQFLCVYFATVEVSDFHSKFCKFQLDVLIPSQLYLF